MCFGARFLPLPLLVANGETCFSNDDRLWIHNQLWITFVAKMVSVSLFISFSQQDMWDTCVDWIVIVVVVVTHIFPHFQLYAWTLFSFYCYTKMYQRHNYAQTFVKINLVLGVRFFILSAKLWIYLIGIWLRLQYDCPSY